MMTYEDEITIINLCMDVSHKDVIEAIKRRRGELDAGDTQRKSYDGGLKKLENMTDEELDSLNPLDLFCRFEEETACKDAYNSIDLLRCPKCGGILTFELLNTKYYHVSEDGAHLIRDFSKQQGADKSQRFLMCRKCTRVYHPKWNQQGKITELEEQP